MTPTESIGATLPGATQSKTPAAAPAKPVISSDFETFLSMLSTQLKNQDPMNPVESADYAVQLATFSSVEQQVLTNQLLEGLMAQQTVAGMDGYAGWIGLEARSDAPTWFDGTTPVELNPVPHADAESAEIVIRDAAGLEVARRDVPTGAQPYYWDGADQKGKALQPGLYSFELESRTDGSVTAVEPLETYGRVVEARKEPTGVAIVLQGGATIAPDGVTGLRQPEP